MAETTWTRFIPSPRIGAWILIGLTLTLLLIRYPANPGSYRYALPTDYSVYLRARDRVNSGENPYQAADSSPYKYSPGVLALVSALPRNPADSWIVFSSLSIFGLAIVLLIGARFPSWKSVLFIPIGLALAWKGVLETLDYGQLELIILLLVVMAAVLRRRHPLIAGFLAGTLPWFKLPWLLLGLPLILGNVASVQGPGRKEKKLRLVISGYLFSWFVLGAAVPSLVFGPERAMQLTQGWIALLRNQPHALYFSEINQSVWISSMRWIGGNPLVPIGLVACAAGFILGSFISRSLRLVSNRDVFAWLSPWLILTQLLNPLSWRWGSVFLVGAPFAIAAGSSRSRSFRITVAFIALLFFLLQMNPVVQALGYHHWSDFHGYGVVTGYWISLLLLCL